MLEHSNHRETQVHSAVPLRQGAGGASLENFKHGILNCYSFPIIVWSLFLSHFYNFYTEETPHTIVFSGRRTHKGGLPFCRALRVYDSTSYPCRRLCVSKPKDTPKRPEELSIITKCLPNKVTVDYK